MDSPVTIDSSTALAAFRDDAVDRHGVAGTDAQPVAGVDMGERDFLVGAVGVMRRAVLGARLSSARMAPPVCSRARSSRTWPSSTSTMMTEAASK